MEEEKSEQLEAARKLLIAADLVWGKDEEEPDGDQTLNMNDVWGWGTAWGARVPDEELIEVGRLVRRYGYCGALYWVSKHHNWMRSEFHDINRFVDFVRNEEAILAEIPGSTKRAYTERTYTIGTVPPGGGPAQP